MAEPAEARVEPRRSWPAAAPNPIGRLVGHGCASVGAKPGSGRFGRRSGVNAVATGGLPKTWAAGSQRLMAGKRNDTPRFPRLIVTKTPYMRSVPQRVTENPYLK